MPWRDASSTAPRDPRPGAAGRDVEGAGLLEVAVDPLVAHERDELAQVAHALRLEDVDLVGEVAHAVVQAVGQRRCAEPAVPAARAVAHAVGLEDHDPQRRVGVDEGDRRPQPGEPAADDDDVGGDPLPERGSRGAGIARREPERAAGGSVVGAGPVRIEASSERHDHARNVRGYDHSWRVVLRISHGLLIHGDDIRVDGPSRAVARSAPPVALPATTVPAHGPRRGTPPPSSTRTVPARAAARGTHPGGTMTTEPASRPTASLKREQQLAMYRRALQTLPGRHGLELPGLGRGHGLRRSRQGRPRSGTSTATSTSTCAWATARSSSATATTASTTTSTSGCAGASASRSRARTRSGRWSSSRS